MLAVDLRFPNPKLLSREFIELIRKEGKMRRGEKERRRKREEKKRG